MPTNEPLPIPVNRTVRKMNSELRAREYLTAEEMEKLIEAAKGNRHELRDSTMPLVVYRHGLRAQEACDLEWSAVDWKTSELHIRRIKSGKSTVHPIRGDELRALRKLRREANGGTFMFMTESGGLMTADALNRMVKRLGDGSKRFGFPIHTDRPSDKRRCRPREANATAWRGGPCEGTQTTIVGCRRIASWSSA
jgi:integrase